MGPKRIKRTHNGCKSDSYGFERTQSDPKQTQTDLNGPKRTPNELKRIKTNPNGLKTDSNRSERTHTDLKQTQTDSKRT